MPRKCECNVTASRYNAPMMQLPTDGGVGVGSGVGDKCMTFGNTVLQGLDQWLPDDKGRVQGTYYSKKAFVPTIDEWGQRVPLVFASLHVKIGGLRENPEETLRAVATEAVPNPRIVGYSQGAKLLDKNIGKPLLLVDLGEVCDPEVIRLYQEARLGTSSAFTDSETKDGKYLLGDIHPDHILLFPRDALRGTEQRDMSACVNTLYVVEAMVSEMTTGGNQENLGKMFSLKNKTALKSLANQLIKTAHEIHAIMKDREPEGEEENLEPLLQRAGEGGPAEKNALASEEEELNARSGPYVPKNSKNKEIGTGSWHKPRLGDYTDKVWDDLSEEERNKIRSCYAAVTDDSFEGCRLGHHEPDGTLNANGVRAALGRLNQTDGISGIVDKVRAHLEAHQSEIEKNSKKNSTPQGEENMAKKSEAEAEAEAAKKKLSDAEAARKKAESELEAAKKVESEAKKACRGSDAEAESEADAEAEAKKAEAEAKKNKKAEAEAKSDKELKDEAKGEDDESEAKQNRKKNTALEARLNALEADLKSVRDKAAADKKRQFNAMLKPGFAKEADKLYEEFTSDAVGFMSTHQNCFQQNSRETDLSGLEYIPDSVTGGGEGPFSEKMIRAKAAQLNCTIGSDASPTREAESTVGSARRDATGKLEWVALGTR